MYICIILLICFFLYVSGIKITFNPFSIKFDNFVSTFILLIINVAIVILMNVSYSKGFEFGAKYVINEIEKYVDTKKSEETVESVEKLESVESTEKVESTK